MEADKVEAVRFASGLVIDKPDRLFETGAVGVELQDDTGLTLLDVTMVITSSPASGKRKLS